MPKIPTYRAKRSIPGVGPAVKADDPSAFGKEYAELTKFGQSLSSIGNKFFNQFNEKFSKARGVSQLASAETCASTAFKNSIEEFKSNSDFWDFEERRAKGSKEIFDENYKKITDPEAKRRFKESFAFMDEIHRIRVRDIRNKKEIAFMHQEMKKAVDSGVFGRGFICC